MATVEHTEPTLHWRHLPHWVKGGLIGVGVLVVALVMLLLYLQSSFYTPPTVEPSLPVNGVVAVAALITYPLRHGLFLGINHGDTFVQLFVGLLLGFIVNVLIVFGSGAGISFLVKPKRLTHSKTSRELYKEARAQRLRGAQQPPAPVIQATRPAPKPPMRTKVVHTPAHTHKRRARGPKIPRIFE